MLQIVLVIIAINVPSMLLEVLLPSWIVDPEDHQITVCRWVDGLYEDTIIRESDCIQSNVVPSFGLNTAQIFNAS